jgi:hypothetical protein
MMVGGGWRSGSLGSSSPAASEDGFDLLLTLAEDFDLRLAEDPDSGGVRRR